MAKNLALFALLAGIASLFLPTQTVPGFGSIGVFGGDMRYMPHLMLMGPSIFASLFGATMGRKRFARGLGALHLIFGAVGILLCSLLFDQMPAAGTWAATASGALCVLAGLIGLVKPDPKRI